MKNSLVFIFTILLSMSAFSEPEFVGNHYVGQPLSKLVGKYGKAIEKFNCGPSTDSACAAKGLKCECKAVKLTAESDYARVLIATIASDKVIAYSDIYSAGPRINLAKLLPKVRSFFGDEKPTEMYDLNTSGDRYQGQFLTWKFPSGAAQAVVFCPLENVGGAKKVDSRVRDCLLKDARVFTHKPVELPSEAKQKSKLEY